MKKHIHLILFLMLMCVVCLIGLQLFWNYQNYNHTVKTFDHDINEALRSAADREIDDRQLKIVNKFEGWLADTSLITITADHNNRDSNTVFHTKDRHPLYPADKGITFGLEDFPLKLNHITPAAKQYLIKHFADRILRRDLQKGIVYNYTQLLGDSLNKIYNASKTNVSLLKKLTKQELAMRGINASFILNPGKNSRLYLTRPVNTHFKRPFKNTWFYAGFQSPQQYFFKQMKWVITTSLLLIGITVTCFAYTAKTLLSQHKLALLKDDFINNMTHELNTPLSSIKITAESLKSFNHTPQIQAEYLDIITYQADKLSSLTEQILNASRMEKQAGDNRALIDLNELIDKAINDMQPQIAKYKAQINYQPLPIAVSVNIEAISMLNAFTNVLDNAIKYATYASRVNISLTANAGYAEITFTDNGIGIPDEYHHKVFEKFFRVPQGNVHTVKGFGLGLSYVSQVIKQHRGAISIAANRPNGSIVTIKLPLN